ncbi:hypothetical protein CCHL11_05967 [Colletotrichum chlorophyti]|uniref:DUF7492 domain-containing protein n=1 Tax=Colletotrichum chlorophyti TaxID=708187 RepID=A0A1Q8RJ78_9PEZI|nr:hypothetical protein CCHL11_05967 [Colletotrichum chlorophyti]
MVRGGSFGAFFVALMMSAPQLANSHTWVEQLNRVAQNGTLIEPAGFSAGWGGRLVGFDDEKYTQRMPQKGFQMCQHPADKQVDGFPRLAAAPGDFVSLRYQENGHVTKPDTPENKPLNRGTVYIYGTTDPKETDTLFDAHRQWTADGKGGDGRGRLLATRNYDDGQCYQDNDAPISMERKGKYPHEAIQPMGVNVWCQTAVQLPEDLAQNSSYTLYWVWTWPTLTQSAVAASKNGQFADFPSGFAGDERASTSDDVLVAEIYTSCSTIDVQGEKLVKTVKGASTGNAGHNLAAFSFPEETNYNLNAVKEQLQNAFIVEVDGFATPGDSNPGNGTHTTSSTFTPTATPTPTVPGVAPGIGKTRVVTVTAQAKTIYSMVTVTIPPQSTPSGDAAGDDGGDDGGDDAEDDAAQASISPTPFLRGRHIRGKDSWNFHNRI